MSDNQKVGLSILAIIFGVLLILGIVISSITLSTDYFAEKACIEYGELESIDVKWIQFDDCYVETSKGWGRQSYYSMKSAL